MYIFTLVINYSNITVIGDHVMPISVVLLVVVKGFIVTKSIVPIAITCTSTTATANIVAVINPTSALIVALLLLHCLHSRHFINPD
jgi:hypothetical protein